MPKTLLLLYNAGREHISNLKAIGPDWNIYQTTDATEAKRNIENAEVVMGNYHLSESLPFNNGSLKWIQTNSIGIDLIKKKCGSYLNNIILSNARGVYDDEISEHTIALILLLQRHLHHVRDAQNDRLWKRPENLNTLQNKNILIAGYGNLGKAIHKKLSVFGCNVFGINTSSQFFKIKNEEKHWKENLQDIDILIMSLPLTDATKNFIGEAELNRLSSNAFVINIGRPETLDEHILFDLLNKNKIAGAALDVFNNEPLQRDDAIWDVPNLFISPHMARSKEIAPPFKFEILFEENFRRYINGEQLMNIIDVDKGY